MRRRVFGALAFAALAVAPSALAGTAIVEYDGRLVTFTAGAGEANHVIVSDEPGGVRIVDMGEPIVAGAGCNAITSGEVLCQSRAIAAVGVELGDLGDFGRVNDGSFNQVWELGGAGNDILQMRAGANQGTALFGGEGDDDLTGSIYRDYMRGGPGADVIRGGASHDVVYYSSRTRAVTVTLADGVANDGVPGEADLLIGIEDVFGGAGDDILTGSGRDNTLLGGEGTDTIIGLGGPDELGGGAGDDVLSGGQGRDDLKGKKGADSIRGGDGQDFLRGGSKADSIRGGYGRDFLRGGSEADSIRGGYGRDFMWGGSKADTFFARDGERDRVRGGAGPDRARIDRHDVTFGIESLF